MQARIPDAPGARVPAALGPRGGAGAAVSEALAGMGITLPILHLGLPDRFVEHGSNTEILRAAYGLSQEDMYRKVLDRWRNLSAERVEQSV